MTNKKQFNRYRLIAVGDTVAKQLENLKIHIHTSFVCSIENMAIIEAISMLSSKKQPAGYVRHHTSQKLEVVKNTVLTRWKKENRYNYGSITGDSVLINIKSSFIKDRKNDLKKELEMLKTFLEKCVTESELTLIVEEPGEIPPNFVNTLLTFQKVYPHRFISIFKIPFRFKGKIKYKRAVKAKYKMNGLAGVVFFDENSLYESEDPTLQEAYLMSTDALHKKVSDFF